MTRYEEPDADQPPEDLTRWLAAGLRRGEALAWRRWNFSLADARRWRAVGVGEALSAAQWQVAGVRPDTVAAWRDAGVTASEAVRWREFGFDLAEVREHRNQGRTPDQAYAQRNAVGRTVRGAGGRHSAVQRFTAAGVSHSVFSSYLHMRWTDDEALAWARHKIPAWDARLWRMIGLVPTEAAALARDDADPRQVIERWWRAGIPFEEVADWLGAGLTPAEAATQRAAGVSVEQAAALRALRRGDTG